MRHLSVLIASIFRCYNCCCSSCRVCYRRSMEPRMFADVRLMHLERESLPFQTTISFLVSTVCSAFEPWIEVVTYICNLVVSQSDVVLVHGIPFLEDDLSTGNETASSVLSPNSVPNGRQGGNAYLLGRCTCLRRNQLFEVTNGVVW